MGDAGAGTHIAILGLVGPAAQDDHIAEGLYRQIAARQRLLFEPLNAEIVGAPFQQGQTAFVFQGFGDGGQIAAVELILQRFRTGGDDHLLLRTQRRRQIGVRFTGAGTRLYHQRLGAVDRLGYRVRHLALRFARLEAGNCLC